MAYFARQYWNDSFFGSNYWGEEVPAAEFSATLQGSGSLIGSLDVGPDEFSAVLSGVGSVVADFQVGADRLAAGLIGRASTIADLTSGEPIYWPDPYWAHEYWAESGYWGHDYTPASLSAQLSGQGGIYARLTAFPIGSALQASLFTGAVPWNQYFRAFPKGAFPEKPFGTVVASLSVDAGALNAVLAGAGQVVADLGIQPKLFNAALLGVGQIALANLTKPAYQIDATLLGQGALTGDMLTGANTFEAALAGVGTQQANLATSFLRGTLTGSGSLISDLTISPSTSLEASIIGRASVSAELSLDTVFSASLTGRGTVDANVRKEVIQFQSLLTGEGIFVPRLWRGTSLLEGDFERIADEVFDKFVASGATIQWLETWQRQGCDSSYPQDIPPATGGYIECGGMRIYIERMPDGRIRHTRQ